MRTNRTRRRHAIHLDDPVTWATTHDELRQLVEPTSTRAMPITELVQKREQQRADRDRRRAA